MTSSSACQYMSKVSAMNRKYEIFNNLQRGNSIELLTAVSQGRFPTEFYQKDSRVEQLVDFSNLYSYKY